MSEFIRDGISARFTQEDLQTRDAVWVVMRDSVWWILIQDHVKLDFFTVPIGKVKKWEDIEEAMKQELWEEFWIRVQEYVRIGACEWEYDYEGTQVKIKTHIFEILFYEGTVENREPEKHRTIRFMDVQEIAQLPRISDATQYVLSISPFVR